jgi:hypothetical protein
MKTKLLCSLTVLAASTSVALAQTTTSPQASGSLGFILQPNYVMTGSPYAPSGPSQSNGGQAPANAVQTPTNGGPAQQNGSLPAANGTQAPPPGLLQPNGSYVPQSDHGGCFSCFGDSCSLGYQCYGNLEYLLWWLHAAHVPPVVGTIPTELANKTDLPPGSISVLFGGGGEQTGDHSGGRLTLGVFLDPENLFAVEFTYFQLENRSRIADFSSPGAPVIGPLFFGVQENKQFIITSSSPLPPDQRSGSVDVGLQDHLWSAELNAKFRLCSVYSSTCYFLLGYRQADFSEGLTLSNDIVFQDPTLGKFTSFDSFGTHNEFYGAQIGIASECQHGPVFANLTLKCAFGDVRQVANIEGVSQEFLAGQLIATHSGGVLAQPTNIGHYSNDRVGILPELTFNVGYQFGPHVRTYIGYDFFYLSKVMRPGDQIDAVDSKQIPNLSTYDPNGHYTNPAFTEKQTDIWAQGVDFGLELRF